MPLCPDSTRISTSIMENKPEYEEIYADLVLELLTAYMLDKSDDSSLSTELMESVRKNSTLVGSGMMQGLVFSSIIHMALMITMFSIVTGRSRQDVLEMYAAGYQTMRDEVSLMPQVHPDFVNKLVDELDSLF